VDRLIVTAPLASSGIVATASLSRREILSAWSYRTMVQSLTVVLICAGLWAMGFHVVRLSHRRLAAEVSLTHARDELLRANEALEAIAHSDGLTGLANRRRLDSSLDNELRRSARSKLSLAVVLVDIDYFKAYNDTYGHVAGDVVLRSVAHAIAGVVNRPADLVARYGGEEIALLLPETNLTGALLVAEAARAAVEALSIEHSGSALGQLTLSAGVGVWTPSVTTEQTVLERADAGLYLAKSAGRNCVRSVDSDTPTSVSINDLPTFAPDVYRAREPSPADA
jgi:diguanylate cyclase (GGDEF)-like protein